MASRRLSFKLVLDNRSSLAYGFGPDTKKQITKLKNTVPRRDADSIFLPAKEVLSLHSIILRSREQEQEFGFDDTYLDLARALRLPTTKGKNYQGFADARNKLEYLIGGRARYDPDSATWYFKGPRNQRLSIGLTAEGIKKVSILDTLLGNRYLSPESIVLIDEPESALHPAAVSGLLDILAVLAETGIQFFLASHSYFVVKKLFLIAQERGWSIPVLSEEEGRWEQEDLLHGMPDNPILRESVRLYRAEVERSLR